MRLLVSIYLSYTCWVLLDKNRGVSNVQMENSYKGKQFLQIIKAMCQNDTPLYMGVWELVGFI